MDPSLLRERQAFKKQQSATAASVGAIKNSAPKHEKDNNGLGGPSAKKKSYGASKKDQGRYFVNYRVKPTGSPDRNYPLLILISKRPIKIMILF
jgi:hypothetical protein